VLIRRALAAQLGVVEHVIVHERGHVTISTTVAMTTCASLRLPHALRQQHERRPQHFAAKRLTCLTTCSRTRVAGQLVVEHFSP
jgi:hypothetical protein